MCWKYVWILISPVVLFKLTEASVMYHSKNVKGRNPFTNFCQIQEGIFFSGWERETETCVCACTCIHICLHLAISQLTAHKMTKFPSHTDFPCHHSELPSSLLKAYSGEIGMI